MMLQTLQILLVGFKLVGLINWSWWQVLIPSFILIGLTTLNAILKEVNK